jgi:hypothetical protein
MDSYLHTHIGEESTVQLRDYNDSNLHLINIHSLYMYNNFFTISEELGNDVFFYKIGSSILIPSGNYSLNSFNKYISSIVGLEKYKVNV